eukprot:CAMPEP_0182580276 /NCGR_PEP_ID=MMETSP1324-20130603/46494_1 /TAXON_ID=236786 /ORGANISM="Florenciella sp., Strain RCC1587" /LENGTH=67 /DNA_ID=CAMNT_0024796473 /DNA_START=93 /DNA_END=293 /DNA_ORIENTATION=+
MQIPPRHGPVMAKTFEPERPSILKWGAAAEAVKARRRSNAEWTARKRRLSSTEALIHCTAAAMPLVW